MHASPQKEPTSPTHWESHFVEQQYGSYAQIVWAQVSQLDVSFVPDEQMLCEQVDVEPPEPPEPPVPPHVLLQMDPTSLTHWESHLVEQQ